MNSADLYMTIEREHQPIDLAWALFNMYQERGKHDTADIYLREARRRIDAMNQRWTQR